jgi:hypothetical protein
VHEAVLAGPHLAAHVDDLAGASEGGVVLDAVPAFDDLGARGAEAEVAAPVGEGVDTCRGHGQQRGGAGVDGQNARGDLHGGGLGRHVTHEAGPVEAVGLGHPHQVEPGLFQFGDGVGRLLETAAVAELHADLHGCASTFAP